MSQRVGNLSFRPPEPGEFVVDKPYSEQTAQIIDEEVMKIVKSAYNRTKKLLTQRKAEVELVRLFYHDCVNLLDCSATKALESMNLICPTPS